MVKGNIYFAQARSTGYIKIGWTKDLGKRLRQLHAQSGDYLDLLIHVMGSTIGHEKMLHQHFRRARIYGEWFEPVPELLEKVSQLRASLPPGKLEEYDGLKINLFSYPISRSVF